MKRLVLIRHAKSSWKHPELADFDRPLNQRGRQDAPMMGERLLKRALHPDVIVSSPALRARQTAEAIAARLALPVQQLLFRPEIYEAESNTLLDLIRGYDQGWQTVFLVGHNPGLTELGNQLATCDIDHLPTCALLVIDFEVSNWRQLAPGAGTLFLYDYPKNPAALPGSKTPGKV